MKKTIFYVWCFLFPLLLQLYSCSEDEAPPIDLTTISKVYRGDELKIFFNGMEYSSEDEAVALTVPSLVGRDNPDEVWQGDGEKMLLQILPLWPEVRYDEEADWKAIIFDIDAVATSNEVHLSGSFSDAPYYLLELEGIVRDGVLTVHLTYTEHVDRVTGNMFVFHFDTTSLDFSMLNPRISVVEYNGEQIPTETFIRETLAPLLSVMRERVGGDLQVEFLPDGSSNVSVLSPNDGTVKPVPGWHGYRMHEGEYGYFCSDLEGGSWITERLLRTEYPCGSDLYCWAYRNLFFISISYQINYDSDLLISLENPYNYNLDWLLSASAVLLRHDLSDEEIEKCEMLALMIQDDTLKRIFIRGEKNARNG